MTALRPLPSLLLMLVLLVSGGAAHGQANLPPQVQADLLVQRIDASVAAGRATEALSAIADYRKLGVKLPMPLLYLEARLAAITKDIPRSRAALSEFLSQPDTRSDKNYATALALYSDLDRQATEQAEAAVRQVQMQCAAEVPRAAAVITARLPGTVFRECALAPEMVIVPAGKFMMGSPSSEKGRFNDEGPQYLVSMAAFAVGKYEVTFDEWDACVAAGGCAGYRPQAYPARGRQPVVRVNWHDAQAYVSWLSTMTGKTYRLLSEAEWEYAARGGTTTPYSTGKTITAAQANFGGNQGARPVGRFPPNAFGVHDTHGNVEEWTQDCWNTVHAGATGDGSARTTGNCDWRVFRGGSWATTSQGLRLAKRGWITADFRNVSLGFRVARTLE